VSVKGTCISGDVKLYVERWWRC